ncbi:MAG: hypothetical protein R3D67_02105 [Hyphomicrobiaceae bacterium]
MAAFLVGVYSIVGGLLADAVTDVIQGLAVIIGLAVLTFFIVVHLGASRPACAEIKPERLQLMKAGGPGGWDRLRSMQAIVMCGSIVAVELISRFLGSRTASIATVGTVTGGLMYLAVGIFPLFLGLIGPSLIKNLVQTEQIVPKLAETYLPPLAYALFIGALVSAILSVVHAALHAPAAQLSHNIVTRVVPGLSDRARLRVVRLCVLALSMVAYGLATSVDRIKELVELASAFGSAGAFVVAIFGLFTRFGGSGAAITALLAGSLVWAWGRFVMALETPYLVGLAAALAGYVLVGLIERHRATES